MGLFKIYNLALLAGGIVVLTTGILLPWVGILWICVGGVCTLNSLLKDDE